METSFDDWLRGRVSGLKPGLVTVSNVSDDKSRPPYRHYTKYSVVNAPAAEGQTDWNPSLIENIFILIY